MREISEYTLEEFYNSGFTKSYGYLRRYTIKETYHFKRLSPNGYKLFLLFMHQQKIPLYCPLCNFEAFTTGRMISASNC